MGDIEHTPECKTIQRVSGHHQFCNCNLEQRLRDEIERLKAAIRKHKNLNTRAPQDDAELYEVLDK